MCIRHYTNPRHCLADRGHKSQQGGHRTILLVVCRLIPRPHSKTRHPLSYLQTSGSNNFCDPLTLWHTLWHLADSAGSSCRRNALMLISSTARAQPARCFRQRQCVLCWRWCPHPLPAGRGSDHLWHCGRSTAFRPYPWSAPAQPSKACNQI